jgi:hypothetical protein
MIRQTLTDQVICRCWEQPQDVKRDPPEGIPALLLEGCHVADPRGLGRLAP